MSRRNLSAIALVVAASLYFWQSTQGAKPKDEMMELYGVFVDAVEQVEANYVRPVSRRALLESALRGMLQDLDPHSQFISESDWKSFKKQIEGRYGGIGIQVELDSQFNRLKVIAPMVGTPAYQAGVLSGDLILEIDGNSTEGLTPDRAVEILTGRLGTNVKLQVMHEGDTKPDMIEITRALIDVPSVLGDRRKPDDTWDFMLDHDKKIGYLRITSFIQNTTEEVKHALSELKEAGMKALVLDLRDDPGGLLSAAVEISDLFVDSGVIVSTKGRNTPSKVYEAQKDALYDDFPMVVLVNQGSASAAEIVSACLQDSGRAKVVGQRSYGKGSVQNILELEDGNSVLKLTVASYLRPSGKNIHRFKTAKETDEWGVSPNPGLEVKLTTEQYIAYARNRIKRDLLTAKRNRKAADVTEKPDAPKPPDEAKPKPDEVKAEEKFKEEPAAKTVEKAAEPPFVDTQLEKALSVVNEELAKPSEKK